MKPRTIIRQAIQKLTINNGDVLLIKKGSELAEQKNFDYFAKHLGKTGREKCLLIRVNNFNDMATLDEKNMNGIGWYKEKLTTVQSLRIED